MTMGLGGICNALHGAIACTIPDDDTGALYRSTNNWFPRRRNINAQNVTPYFELWRRSCLSEDCSPMSNHGWMSTADHASYEEWSGGFYGKAGSYYLKGQVVNASDVPQTGVVVKGFRTSDDLFVGQTTSDSSGNYMLATPYSGVSHYIVAYLDTATDLVGTTVNNLTPTAS